MLADESHSTLQLDFMHASIAGNATIEWLVMCILQKVNDKDRPDEAFTTDRAVRAGRANAASGRIMVTVPGDHFGPIPPEADPRGQVCAALAVQALRIYFTCLSWLPSSASVGPLCLRSCPQLQPSCQHALPARILLKTVLSYMNLALHITSGPLKRWGELCRASRWANGGRTAWTVASGERTFRMWRASLGNPGRGLSLSSFPAGGAQPLGNET